LRLCDVGERTGVSVDRLEALIYAGLIPDALFDDSGKPLYLFEDSVPSREQLLDLLSSLGGSGEGAGSSQQGHTP